MERVGHLQSLMAGMTTREFTVTCLCAEWCWVCRDYQAGFLALAGRYPQASFAWIDVEEAEEEFEVDNFPTIVVKRGEQALFHGVVRADPANLARLLEKLLT